MCGIVEGMVRSGEVAVSVVVGMLVMVRVEDVEGRCDGAMASRSHTRDMYLA